MKTTPKYETSSGISGSMEPKKEGVPKNTIRYITFLFTCLKFSFTYADKKIRERERERERERKRARERKRENRVSSSRRNGCMSDGNSSNMFFFSVHFSQSH